MKIVPCLIAFALTAAGCRPASPAGTPPAATRPAPLLRDEATVNLQGPFKDDGKIGPFVTLPEGRVYLTGNIQPPGQLIYDGSTVTVEGLLRRYTNAPRPPAGANEVPKGKVPDHWYVENAQVRVVAPPTTVPVTYDPPTFRADVQRLTAAGQYRQAVALVAIADVDRQVAFDRRGYVAVGEDAIVLPGLETAVGYDRVRDWFVPGTSDAVVDGGWQAAATEFARRYNLRRAAATR